MKKNKVLAVVIACVAVIITALVITMAATGKFASLKKLVANRSPLDLGNRIKRGEIVFHHEVTNQMLWTDF